MGRFEIFTLPGVEKGELVNDGHGPYATTDEEFGDIELLMEYKTVPKADSGIAKEAQQFLAATPLCRTRRTMTWPTARIPTSCFIFGKPSPSSRRPGGGSGYTE